MKNEMRDLAGGSLHFTTVYNFLQIQFCHVLLLLGGGVMIRNFVSFVIDHDFISLDHF